MKHKKILSALATVALISACSDSSVGVSTTDKSGASDELRLNVSKDRVISQRDSSENSIKVNLMSVYSYALEGLTGSEIGEQIRAADAVHGMENGGATEFFSSKLVDILEKNPNESKNFVSDLDDEGKEAFGKGSKAFREYLRKKVHFGRYYACTDPLNAWERMPDYEQYMRGIAASCDYTIAMMSDVSEKLIGKTFENKDHLVAEITKILRAYDLVGLDAVWAVKAADATGRSYRRPANDPGVSFYTNRGNYVNTGGGFKVEVGSSKTFGDGFIAGRVHEFSVKSAMASGFDKKKTANIGIASDNVTNSDAKTNVK